MSTFPEVADAVGELDVGVRVRSTSCYRRIQRQ